MIPAVVLAAGKSTRMGRSKAMLQLPPSDTFLTRIIRAFQDAGADDVVVVLGYEAEMVRASVIERGLSPRFVLNEDYESGQLSSLLAGLNLVDRPGVEAMLLTLVDVPFVSSSTIRAVMQRYRTFRPPIVRPVRGGLHGHPVLVDRSLFQLLRGADPGAGPKPIIRAHISAEGDLPVDDEGAFVDVDTPEDYARLAERFVGPGFKDL